MRFNVYFIFFLTFIISVQSTFHGVVEQLEVVLGARVKSTFEVSLQSLFDIHSLHNDSQLFPLLLAAQSQSQIVGVTLRQHATEVLLYCDHLHMDSYLIAPGTPCSKKGSHQTFGSNFVKS